MSLNSLNGLIFLLLPMLVQAAEGNGLLLLLQEVQMTSQFCLSFLPSERKDQCIPPLVGIDLLAYAAALSSNPLLWGALTK